MRFVLKKFRGKANVNQVDKLGSPTYLFPSLIDRVTEGFQGIGVVSFSDICIDEQDDRDGFRALIEAELEIIAENSFFDRLIRRQADKHKLYRAGLGLREEIFGGLETLLEVLLIPCEDYPPMPLLHKVARGMKRKSKLSRMYSLPVTKKIRTGLVDWD